MIDIADEALQLLVTIGFTAVFFVVTWLITKFHGPEELEAKFAAPWKEAALALGYVAVAFIALAVVFSFQERSVGRPIGVPSQFDLPKAALEWGIYALMSFIPVTVIIKLKKQSFETVGVTRKNLGLSFGVGIALSFMYLILSTAPALFLGKLLTYNGFAATIYFLSVGFGEEYLFRGFVLIRCSTWLGDTAGLILVSTMFAFVHLPQRIFVMGMDPSEAIVSAIMLLPISLLLGYIMLRTRNIVGPAILHTIANLIGVL
jgi:membrane protease YdiL (CAAX protease family)